MAENIFEALTEFRAAQDQQVVDVKTVVQEAVTGSTSGVDATDESLAMAVRGQTDTVVSTAAQVQKLTSQALGQGFSGTNAIDEFEYVNTGGLDAAQWQTLYNLGSSAQAIISTDDGHNAAAKWSAGQTNTPWDILERYIGPGRTSLTDYQKNTVIIGAQGEGPFFGDPRRGYYNVYARISSPARTTADGISWVRGYVSCFGESGIEYRVNGGAITALNTPTPHYGFNPGPGNALSLEAGFAGSSLIFRFLVNGTVYSSATDGSAVTKVGADYREHGLGMSSTGLLPGSLNQYTSNDNQPAGVVGSGVKLYRASTGTYTQSGAGLKLPNGALDSIQYRTPDIDVDPVTFEITINTTGWYLFYSRFGRSTLSTNQIGACILYKGANPIARLGQGGAATTTGIIPMDATPQYVEAGDKFSWGYGQNSGNATFGPGDANGVEFYCGATLLNTQVK